MEIEWNVWLTSAMTDRKAKQMNQVMQVAPILAERLQVQFGGILPEKLNAVLVDGPVAISVRVRKGKPHRDVTTGLVIWKDGVVEWLLVSIGHNRSLIHELMHILGFAEEKFVRQAVRDFVNVERWHNQNDLD